MDWKKIGLGAGLTALAPFTGGGSLAFLTPALAGAGIGTAIGGAFDASGKPKAESTDANAIDPILKSLQDKSGSAGRQGDQLSGMSQEALAPVLDYFKKILGNDPSAMLSATAPQRGRVIDQYDTARKSIANFAPRGGGSSEALANSYVTEGQDLSALTSQARNEAVGQSAQLGESLKALGITQEQLASGDLNAVVQAILSRQGLALQKSGQKDALYAGGAEAIGQLLGMILTRNGGAKAPTTPTGPTVSH